MFRLIPHRLLVQPRAVEVQIDRSECRATLQVEGLVCSLCAARVQRALAAVPGVHGAAVDLETGTARLEMERAGVSSGALTEAVESTVILRPLRRLMAAVGRRLASDRH